MQSDRLVLAIALAAAAAAALPAFCVPDAHASNPNLSVSAENPLFENHFAGSVVVEVVVRDPGLNDTGEGKGEPDVTINGKALRMVQASDGNWYAYFANADRARAADSTVGLAGYGLDFGVFCGRDTPPSVFGIDLSDTDGFSVPSPSGLTGFANGREGLSECGGAPDGLGNHNNVVRKARSINTNPGVLPGQIGLEPAAWPLVQLFSFGDVTIKYSSGAGLQQARLGYGDAPGTSLKTDRGQYPQNAEVFLTVTDVQLNQDPTDADSWTFGVGAPGSVFYQAFGGAGSNDANGDSGLVDLSPHLSGLGFEDNGTLAVDAGKILGLKASSEQPLTFVSDGADTFSPIVTLVEDGPSSGVFDTGDYGDESTISIQSGAPRGHAGSISYGKGSISVLTGPSAAGISVGGPSLVINGPGSLAPGTEFRVVLTDEDQNLNSGAKDDLDVFRPTATIPTLKIGNPLTLENASDVRLFRHASGKGQPANSSVPDANSSRLFIDTSGLADGPFEKISLSLGVQTPRLASALVIPSRDSAGTNWLNYDLRSIEKNLQVSDFSDTSVELFFGSLDSDPVRLAGPGTVASSRGLVQLGDGTVREISGKTGTVFAVINFDDSDDSSGAGFVSSDGAAAAAAAGQEHPIVLDFFSFGLDGSLGVNNAVYRFELEETAPDSSVFEGTVEFAVANQLNILDPSLVQSIRTIDDEIRFIVVDRLTGKDGVSISYSDLDDVGIVTNTSSRSDARTNSGSVFLDSGTYRFGQPVTFTLRDPDLNLRHDRVDIYGVIDDPASPNVDTVGSNGNILLEILIKDTRYKRCTIDGKEHGGLAASGFSLTETSAGSGIFEGMFKMPSEICDESGTRLVSTAGGSLDAKYYDYQDDSGSPNIFSSSKNIPASPPQLDVDEITVPLGGNVAEAVLSGSVANHKRGAPLTVVLTHPDGTEQAFAASLSPSGGYRTVFTISGDSLPGTYGIQLYHDGKDAGSASFAVSSYEVPNWIKDAAELWSGSSVPDSEFMGGIKHLIGEGVIAMPAAGHGDGDDGDDAAATAAPGKSIPGWVKTTAGWWAHDHISDDEFLGSIQFLIKIGIIRV